MPAGTRQRDVPRAAVQQLHAQIVFQLFDEGAERRLGDVHTVAGRGELPGLHDVDESAQLFQRDVHTEYPQ